MLHTTDHASIADAGLSALYEHKARVSSKLSSDGLDAGKKKGVKTKGKSKKTRRADEVEKAFKEADASATASSR